MPPNIPGVNVFTDVLVVGAGPSGYMAALTLVRYGVDVRIIDKRPVRVQNGYASGLQPRTQEILQTLNLLEPLDARGNRMSETAFWGPDHNGILSRCFVGPEVTSTTNYPHVLVADQGVTEGAFDDELKSRSHAVSRSMELVHYTYDSIADRQWPVTAYVRNYSSGAIEVWHTKYLIGDSGFRAYLQLQQKHLDKLDGNIPAGLVHPSIVLPENSTLLFEILQECLYEIMAPFDIEITRVFWISRYRVIQSIANRFVDLSRRVYLVGDACHTQSPKAGQSMNLGMLDSYNLTWKLSLVLKGMASPGLLETYQMERRYIANQFIEFDIKFAHLYLQKEALSSPEIFCTVWKQSHGFISGCSHRYLDGLLTRSSIRARINQAAKEPLTPGKRMHTMSLTRHMDGTAVDLLEDMPSNGRFHLFVFAGKLMTFGVFKALANSLASAESPLTYFFKDDPARPEVFEHENIRQDEVRNRNHYLDLFLVHSSNHLEIELSKLPAPFSLWATRVYEDIDGIGHATHGVSERDGALALVRPDGIIGLVTSLQNPKGILDYFKDFMLEFSSGYDPFGAAFRDSSCSLGDSLG
ncbi:MAG: hypothetical protein LQ350_005675 [Teloschistes chrysophthalmus]|nr:MAG: hypothetical protein LQ350_005675 [Niorma chrysophthalma]